MLWPSFARFGLQRRPFITHCLSSFVLVSILLMTSPRCFESVDFVLCGPFSHTLQEVSQRTRMTKDDPYHQTYGLGPLGPKIDAVVHKLGRILGVGVGSTETIYVTPDGRCLLFRRNSAKHMSSRVRVLDFGRWRVRRSRLRSPEAGENLYTSTVRGYFLRVD